MVDDISINKIVLRVNYSIGANFFEDVLIAEA